MAKKRLQVSKAELVKAVIEERKKQAAVSGRPARWGRGYMLLPEQENQVVFFYQMEPGISFAEIGRRVGCSTTTVTRTLHRKGLRNAPQNTPQIVTN